MNFTWEHENGDAKEWPIGKETEYERRGYLVGCVGCADIEVGQVRFHEVTNHDFQFSLLRSIEERNQKIRKSHKQCYIHSLSLHTPDKNKSTRFEGLSSFAKFVCGVEGILWRRGVCTNETCSTEVRGERGSYSYIAEVKIQLRRGRAQEERKGKSS